MKINSEYVSTKYFADVIGQDELKHSLSIAVASVANGGELNNSLFLGPAGNGKTFLARKFGAALKELADIEFIFIPGIGHLAGGPSTKLWDDTVSAMADGRYLIFIDEAHEMYQSGSPANLKYPKAFRKFIREATQPHDRTEFMLVDEYYVPYGRESGFCLATNFPDKLDHAQVTRLKKYNLDLYTEDELATILERLLASKGLRANHESLRSAAKCCRGTARPMERMLEQMIEYRSSEGIEKTSINKEDIQRALNSLRIYPLGLDHGEARLLANLTLPLTIGQIDMASKDFERKGIKSVLEYALAEKLVAQSRSTFCLTDKGVRYFETVKTKFPNLPELKVNRVESDIDSLI